MTPDLIAAEVLGCDPATLKVVRIKGGLTNETWRVHNDDAAVVVRISTVDEKALQLDRANEAVVLRLVEQADIGAKILLCAPERRLLVTRALPAETLSLDHLYDLDVLRQVAVLLQKLHRLAVPSTVQAVNLLSVLEGYWQTLDARGVTSNDTERELARSYAVESAQFASPCLCHHDVHHLNLMSNGQRLWLLDWEYAGLGDPLFDLASICCYHNYDSRLREQLLQAYRGGISQHELQRLERMCWLFDYIKSLWMQVRQLEQA